MTSDSDTPRIYSAEEIEKITGDTSQPRIMPPATRHAMMAILNIIGYIIGTICTLCLGVFIFAIVTDSFSPRVRTETWRDKDIKFTVYYKNDVPFKKRIDFTDRTQFEGPVTPTQSNHGCWIHRTPDKNNPGMDIIYSKFYWYGEEITEAKWHELTDKTN